MEFEWDEAKRLSNLAKHGLDFANSSQFDWAGATILSDRRVDYGENRFRAFAMLNEEFCSIAYTLRGAVTRILSLRLANRK